MNPCKSLACSKCSVKASQGTHPHLRVSWRVPGRERRVDQSPVFLSWGHRKLAPPNTCQGEEETWRGRGEGWHCEVTSSSFSFSENCGLGSKSYGDGTSATRKHSHSCTTEGTGGLPRRISTPPPPNHPQAYHRTGDSRHSNCSWRSLGNSPTLIQHLFGASCTQIAVGEGSAHICLVLHK